MKTAMARWWWAGGLLAMVTACNAAVDASPAAEGTNEPVPGTVGELPLRRGFYVRSDDTCAAPSNATLALVGRDSITGCDLAAIERIGETRYRVKERCAVRGAPPGHEHERDESTNEYEILAEDRYRVTFEYGETVEFSFCPQEQLPEPWRSNDISGLIGG